MPTLDQSQTSDDTQNLLRYNSGNSMDAQSFVPSVTADIAQTIFKIYKNGSPTGNVWCQIWTDNSGTPNVQTGANSSSLDVSTFGTSPGAEGTFNFSAGLGLTSGGTYWMVLQGDFPLSQTDNLGVRRNSAGGYANGSVMVGDGTTWGANAGDYYFKEYYTPAAGGAAFFGYKSLTGVGL